MTMTKSTPTISTKQENQTEPIQQQLTYSRATD